MTEIKFCGIQNIEDVEAANHCCPDYVGFVFVKKSRRCVTIETARKLKVRLNPGIKAVGVFADEAIDRVAKLLNSGVIEMAQLHGTEDEAYMKRLRMLTKGKIIKAFCIQSKEDLIQAEECSADEILLDSGAGTGCVFDWMMLENMKRQYFLAGGLSSENVQEAIRLLHPMAVDVSTGIESDGKKDERKMMEFVKKVRKEERL